MSDYDDWDGGEEESAPTKEVYESVLGHLRHNTGGYQPPLHRQAPHRCAICDRGYKPEWVDNAINRARTNGDIFRWKDPRDGKMYLGLDDADELRERVASYAQRRSEPRKDLISVANQRIQYLQSE